MARLCAMTRGAGVLECLAAGDVVEVVVAVDQVLDRLVGDLLDLVDVGLPAGRPAVGDRIGGDHAGLGDDEDRLMVDVAEDVDVVGALHLGRLDRWPCRCGRWRGLGGRWRLGKAVADGEGESGSCRRQCSAFEHVDVSPVACGAETTRKVRHIGRRCSRARYSRSRADVIGQRSRRSPTQDLGHAVGRRAHGDASGLESRLLAGIAALVAHHDGAGVPHALAGRRGGAGNEGGNRLFHGPGVLGRLLLHGAADLADQRDRLGSRVLVERHQRILGGGADDGIAADADEGGDAEPRLHQVEAQRACRASPSAR